MTKKEIAIEILSETSYNFEKSYKYINKIISRKTKEQYEMIYKAFLKDKEHANFYWRLLY